ncbi:MAG: ATP-binding cassette domain-containing protein [Chloroflexi bacterium]|nr:ATP-binding cassette domain-containing protein [Chloroflexota bacterium]
MPKRSASEITMDIELRNIHKRFGAIHANNDINVKFSHGRIVGILGENGAGKSTLMKILSGFQPADEGEILIDNDIIDYTGPTAAIANGIGMLQQDPLDVGAFTVLENFIYGGVEGITLKRAEAAARLKDLSRRFGFELDPFQPIDNLLIAQRQQLEIIRLLALGVETLILDEPTTGISADQKDILFDALRRLAHDEGLVVLLVSHKLEDVIDLCDEVVVLRNGVMVGEMDMPVSDDNLTSAVIAETKQQLVTMMFGEVLEAQQRPQYEIGAPVLITEELVVHDQRLDMQPITLTAQSGEVIGLAGLGGSGQELFMRACARLQRIDSGALSFDGQSSLKSSYRQLFRRGCVFGAAGRLEEGLIAGLTLTEHSALVSDDKLQIDWKSVEKQTASRIDRYRIKGRNSDTIEQLSGGNQQRVLIGLLPDDPKLLILEQPTRGLDVDSARWIWTQLLERCQRGAAIIFNSSDLEELVTYSDRIFVFYAGQNHEVPDVNQTTIDELGHMIGGDFNN